MNNDVPQKRRAEMSSRRKFVKLITFGTATGLVGGKLWQREVLAYCEPTEGVANAVLKIKLSDYPALSQELGSVRLGINPVQPYDEPYPDGDFYPFLINRGYDNNYYVLDCQCRHAGCVVPTYDVGTNVIRCPCHLSGYDIDGSVVNGPATDPLYNYPFKFEDPDTMVIEIPCWNFDIKASVLPSGGNGRLKLEWNANANATYEVTFREKLSDPWVKVPLATTPTGPANQMSIKTVLSQFTSVYLDRTTPTGFFAMGLQVGEV